MATRIEERYSTVFHWGSILSGTAVALGVWLMLYTLGAAIGFSTGSQSAFSAWTAIYTLVSPILGLLCGGIVAGQSGAIRSRGEGALHGLVVWGLATVVVGFLLGNLNVSQLTGNLNIQSGYMWAVFGSIFVSAIAAVSGASASAKDRERVATDERGMAHREVHT